MKYDGSKPKLIASLLRKYTTQTIEAKKELKDIVYPPTSPYLKEPKMRKKVTNRVKIGDMDKIVERIALAEMKKMVLKRIKYFSPDDPNQLDIFNNEQ